MLVSEPVIDYPRRDRPYALITDAAAGDEKNEGGLGAILTQINPDGEHSVIAYASRKLAKHEKNYTPFLLEMQASIWGMEHFCTNLRGRHFTLFTDHRPMEKLGKVHTKTLYRLQEMMTEFDFELVYKKGSEMPADFLSRHAVNNIQVSQRASSPRTKTRFIYMTNLRLPAASKNAKNMSRTRTVDTLRHQMFHRRRGGMETIHQP